MDYIIRQFRDFFNDLTSKAWEFYRQRGNKCFVARDFEQASIKYTKALALMSTAAPKDRAMLLANRAAAYLNDDQPSDALADCLAALELETDHTKATFRMAKAHAQLCRYRKAKEMLENHPQASSSDFKPEISRLNRLILESERGEYDLKSMLREAAATKTPRLDHADFNGGVAVEWISDAKGNGLVATRDFAPGDLLFVSKAFEICFTSEAYSAKKCYDMEDLGLHPPATDGCVARIMRRVSKDNTLTKELYRLYAGPNLKRVSSADSDDAFGVDAKRIAMIVSLNSFSDIRMLTEDPEADPTQIGGGVPFNGTGLWLLASFMNHSCLPNVFSLCLGDVVMYRASKPIRKGEELTTCYAGFKENYLTRQQGLARYGFRCDCALCSVDAERIVAQPSLHSERDAFMRQFEASTDAKWPDEIVQPDAKVLATIIEDVRRSAEEFSKRLAYKNRWDPQLSGIYNFLGLCCKLQKERIQAAQAYEMSYFAAVGKETNLSDAFLPNSQPTNLISYCFDIACNYTHAYDFANGQLYARKMLEAAAVAYGEADVELLALLFPKLSIKNLLSALQLT